MENRKWRNKKWMQNKVDATLKQELVNWNVTDVLFS